MKIILDEQQQKLQKKLVEISQKLTAKKTSNSKSLIKKLKKIFLQNSSNNQTISSLYIYGGVGVGKSILMTEFYQNLSPSIKKCYFHFNSFMRLVHQHLHQIRSENKHYRDQLIEAIDRILSDIDVLCFDEFQVFDIADASLLARIFSYLFSHQVVVIFTSNSKPHDLYPNGIQREIFIKFIDEILLKNCEIFFIETTKDYRLDYLKNISDRYLIKNPINEKKFYKMIETATKQKNMTTKILKVWGRDLIIKKTFQNIALIDFSDLCNSDLAASDFAEICSSFDLIFISNLPELEVDEISQVNRLILFIDEVYESKTALIILSYCEIEKIYPKQFQIRKNLTSFARTISRLHQIKSDYYWQNSKINN
jgi:predicted ATPase